MALAFMPPQGRIKVNDTIVTVLLGIDNDQLIIQNVARMLREEIRKAKSLHRLGSLSNRKMLPLY